MVDQKVTIKIEGESNNFVKATKATSAAAKKSFKSVSDSAKKARKSIAETASAVKKKLTRSFTKARISFKKAVSPLKAFTVTLAAVGVAVVASVRAFAKFQNAMRGVKTLLDENSFGAQTLDDGFKQMERDALSLSKTVPSAMEEITKAIFDTVSAGVAAGEAIEFVGVASKLAVAGITNVAIATDGMTSALNAYQFAAEDADSIAAKFFTAQKFGKTTVEELSASFGLVGASAQAAGVSFEELLASVAAATAGGIKTNAAYTGIKAILANVAKPTKEAALEAKRLGIEFSASALRAEGLEVFLNKITSATNFTKDSVTRLFGSVEAQSIAFALTGTQAKAFARNIRELSDEQKLAETFTKAYNEQNSTLENKMKKTGNIVNATAISIGDKLAPAVNVAIDTFNDMVGASESWVVAFTPVKFLMDVLIGLFVTLKTVVTAAADVIGAFWGTVFGAISQALEGNFKQAFETIKSGFGDAIGQGVDTVKKGINDIANLNGGFRKEEEKKRKAENKKKLDEAKKLLAAESQAKREQAEKDKQFGLELAALTNEERAALRLEDQERIQSELKNRRDIEADLASEALSKRIAERNKFQEDEIKSSEGVAKANAFFRREEVGQTQQALGNLATLTNSKSKELFELGKAASLASASINIAQGFTKALAQGGIFGPILGATVLAAGAVQLASIKSQKFQGMAAGGLVQGGIPGKDSVPIMAQDGELMVPRKNFDDVVSDAAARQTGGAPQGANSVAILKAKGGFMDYVEVEMVRRKRNGTSRLPKGFAA